VKEACPAGPTADGAASVKVVAGDVQLADRAISAKERERLQVSRAAVSSNLREKDQRGVGRQICFSALQRMSLYAVIPARLQAYGPAGAH